MHFNFACATACLFAVAAFAVPVEVERKVVVVRSDACPAPAPPAPAQAPPAPAPPVSNPPPVQPSPPAPAPPQVSNPSEQTNVNKQCAANTSVHCCDTVDSTDNSNIVNQLSAAGIDHQEAKQKGQVGLTCTPITTSLVDALNGNVCQGATTACCEDTNQTGLVNLNLGCTIIPVTL
ncbi:uncharacterized protein TRUGW13939_07416 [Talaromyces rugulosus]|uniref:Hydrophobin n=1 Tax=Talaromyces rugulosus TaxID=121627 RepID=A0A7H8R630_TALRU|nr:uncharacterized protein TRUGW13939_07416 [Talaromyces rugulosus]QKX60273.1 hypothetical protein TRUGW13939_07416 [Talaromyces rugulosus]